MATQVIDFPKFGSMKHWLCEYRGPDGRYGIVLPATDPNQILHDWCEDLPALKILGQVESMVIVIPDEEDPDKAD